MPWLSTRRVTVEEIEGALFEAIDSIPIFSGIRIRGEYNEEIFIFAKPWEHLILYVSALPKLVEPREIEERFAMLENVSRCDEEDVSRLVFIVRGSLAACAKACSKCIRCAMERSFSLSLEGVSSVLGFEVHEE